MANLLSLLKRAARSPSARAAGLTAGVGAGVGYGLGKAGILQLDPWGEKREAYERDLGEQYIKQEAFERSKKQQQKAYKKSKKQDKDQFGFGVDLKKSDWIPFTHEGKKYKFANIPEVHEVMQAGSMFDIQPIFDELMDKGYIRKDE